MSRDIRIDSALRQAKKQLEASIKAKEEKDFEEALNAAFEIFMADYEGWVAIRDDPDVPIELKYAVKMSVKKVFRAGFSSYYASYVLDKAKNK